MSALGRKQTLITSRKADIGDRRRGPPDGPLLTGRQVSIGAMPGSALSIARR